MRWHQIISDLVAAGFTQAQIAARIGCTQQNVSAIQRGLQIELSFTRGKALMELHRCVMARRA